jgi:hypothetical protein
MNNIVSLGGAGLDAEILHRKARAYEQLEEPIRDLRDMAKIAAKEFGSLKVYGDRAADTASFAVHQLEKMAQELWDKHHALISGK